ncbi:tRNA (adenosine(37)-N6)-dimethylallyltransferase MiaA [Altererythrobacter sp. CC-YST694]|uniref:tRNA (adenosine(37)-N6)-dimethylallyltransferase MiaA n=1 Tax=Altererythrobacter sp. CC-YST694 TaxID=2755038 RepID=UPI001D0049A9|nr:tRNA (adenosine(37)-N6)-dimethylallyltransferase MiaA [Altererythrobacter sp. CC-YST694]MCB5424386.1 tRNA (adenosine(37)-N6)-dimethylallyltransferase MiaA [Altererythrobacter sp. CC-YST694]
MSKDQSPNSSGHLPALALIAGPTASGKSDLAVRLALALASHGRRGVVVNADASQVYADLAVLSARPSAEQMQGVEHRLFGAWEGATACSAADWAAAARREIAEIQAQGAVPILVGGTGLYIRTLLDGIAPVPEIDANVRDEVRAMAVSEAYEALKAEDPERAARLDAADTTRVARALEVIRSTGKPLSFWQARSEGGISAAVDLHAVVLLPPRDELYRRCDARFARMLESGAVEEVKALLARRLDPALPVMRAIGVPEIAGFLRGEWSLAEAQSKGSQATRNYVKRQFTWAKHQFPGDWQRFESHDYPLKFYFERLLPN